VMVPVLGVCLQSVDRRLWAGQLASLMLLASL
jgi:hypothetical protein